MSEVVTAAPAPSKPQFDFAKPFTYVFDDPDWMKKIAIGGLMYLAGIFIIGWFFVLGYIARTARNIVAGVERPLPEWDDLGGFLTDGLRLVGVIFCYIAPIVFVAFMIMIPAGVLAGFENEGVAALGSGMAGCLSCLIVPLALTVMFFAPASLLFAAIEQRFAAAFEFGRIFAFIKENIGNYLLAFIVYLIARTIGGIGVILLCIGVIFTAFWSFLISTYAFSQVYRLATRRE